MIPKLLLVGGGGHCRSCIEAVESTGKFAIEGIVGLPEEVGRTVLGYPVLGCDDDLPRLVAQCRLAIVAAGQIKTASLRMKLYRKLIDLNAELPTIVASSATISRHARIGQGTIVMHGAIINAGAVVGINCIVNTRALIEHDSIVGDHCHISTASVLNGAVHVGDESFVGSGAIVHHGVRIGGESIVAAGAVIAHDVEARSVVGTNRYARRAETME